jgi:hypothetical protein
MSTAKRVAKKTPPKTAEAPAVPPALKARAEATAEAALAKHRKRAEDAVARAKTALASAEHGLYEVALALKELDDPRRLAALGAASVFEVAEAQLGLSRNTVTRLRRAADAVDAARFAKLGHTRVNALLELADATAADDTEAVLAEKTVALWEGGPRFDVKDASAKKIRAAAAEVRAHHAADGTRTEKRGNQVKDDARALAAALADALKRRGVEAKVKARATKPGAPPRFEITELGPEEVAALTAALAKKRKK